MGTFKASMFSIFTAKYKTSNKILAGVHFERKQTYIPITITTNSWHKANVDLVFWLIDVLLKRNVQVFFLLLIDNNVIL